jgi:OFA family oxalate/formate antiporter-like MFS transporter
LGLAAAWGGIKLPLYGPRKLAVAGGALYGLGYLVSGLALHWHSLPLFYLGFGVVGGAGLGLGYVTPVATAAKWFPDRKGLVTGMVVMGFGFGALVMSKLIGPALLSATGGNLVATFCLVGAIMLVTTVPAGASLCNPPPGFAPPGLGAAAAATAPQGSPDDAPVPARTAILSGRFALMWVMFFCNICAGIMFIGLQSPKLQDLLRASDPTMNAAGLATAGATLIATSSVFNGLGRLFWGTLSDRIGRSNVFRLILGTQVVVFVALMFVTSPWLFGALVCYVLLCYGGGFGSMPSFVLDVFGSRLMGVVYGTILTAWSIGGIVGPQVAAVIKDTYPSDAGPRTFAVAAGFLALGFVLSLVIKSKRFTSYGQGA